MIYSPFIIALIVDDIIDRLCEEHCIISTHSQQLYYTITTINITTNINISINISIIYSVITIDSVMIDMHDNQLMITLYTLYQLAH